MEDKQIIKKYFIKINNRYLKKLDEQDYYDFYSEDDFKTRKEYEDYLFKEATTRDIKYEANSYGNGFGENQMWSLQKYDIEIHKFFGNKESPATMESILNHFKNIFTTYEVNIVELKKEIITKIQINQIT